MRKNLNLWIMIMAVSIFVVGCSEERSVAPVGNASPAETSPAEASSVEQTDGDAAAESGGSSSNEGGSGL